MTLSAAALAIAGCGSKTETSSTTDTTMVVANSAGSSYRMSLMPLVAIYLPGSR